LIKKEMTSSKIKILLLALIMFVIIVLFWYYLSLFFHSTSSSRLLCLGIVWLIFLAFSLLFLVLIQNRNTVYLTYVLGLGSFFLFFVRFEKLTVGVYAICLLIFLILIIIGYERISKEKNERLKLSLKKIWKRGLPFLTLGLSLVIAVVYYFNPLLRISQEKIEIPPQVFSLIIRPFSGTVSKMLPFYDPKMTIDEMLTAGTMFKGETSFSLEDISPELIQEFGNLDFENLDIDQLLKDPRVGDLLRQGIGQQTEEVDASFLKNQRAGLEESLGVSLEGDETFDLVLAKIVNSKISEFVGPYAKEVSLGIAVVLFLILRFLSGILSFVIIILAHLIFSLLLLFKIVQKGRIMKEGETIVV